jgi:alkanesulfonate monooxygenase SsuD/methylene tetrahydromethanopterin reductase-like flavin-dependent oxidoreductase (luciferase family)
VSVRLEAVLPFWLDRPDREALDIADTVSAAGIDGLWIGEMATFDAFALATAVGLKSPRLRLNIGPLPISVRSPAAIALGASSVAALTGCEVNVALGASSPFIVSGWRTAQRGCAKPRRACVPYSVGSARTMTAGTCAVMDFGCVSRCPRRASGLVPSARR